MNGNIVILQTNWPAQLACTCGANTFEVAPGAPIQRFFCHCLYCQQFTGKPFTDVTFVRAVRESRPLERRQPAINSVLELSCAAANSKRGDAVNEADFRSSLRDPRAVSWRHTPGWISLGGAWLALCAGFINAAGFLQIHEHGLTHVTGQVTRVGIEVAAGRFSSAGEAGVLVLWFFLGAMISGVIIRKSELSARGRPYGVALLVEATLLGAATLLMVNRQSWGSNLAAVAAGLQNALATSYSGAIVRTTHMTGIVTDLGLLFGHAVRGEQIEWAKARLLGLLLGSFLAGGVLGAVAFPALGPWALLPPTIALTIAAFSFLTLLARPPAPRAER